MRRLWMPFKNKIGGTEPPPIIFAIPVLGFWFINALDNQSKAEAFVAGALLMAIPIIGLILDLRKR